MRDAGQPPPDAGAHIRIRHLSVVYPGPRGPLRAVRDLSLEIGRGEIVGVVGESGSGKSTLGGAIAADLPGAGTIVDGEVVLAGRDGEPPVDLCALPERQRRPYWGRRLAIVFQNPAAALNPAYRVGDQIDEAVARRPELATAGNRARSLDLLHAVHMQDPARLAGRYPHELSGGQQQRVVIAMALAADPDVLVLDEPTTGLDVTTEAQVLELLRELRARVNAAIVLITHNLAVVAQIADRVAVMYAGELVEVAATRDLFRRPAAPYTKGLLACVPRVGFIDREIDRLPTIPGVVPRLDELPVGCAFAARCPFVRDRCHRDPPELRPASAPGRQARCHFVDEVQSMPWPPGPAAVTGPAPRQAGATPLLTVHDLHKRYGRAGGWARIGRSSGRGAVRALNGVSLAVASGRTLGVVGESGCGKTTLANVVAGLVEPSHGVVRLNGDELAPRLRDRPPSVLRRIQMIFQNPEASLNPQQRVGQGLRRAAQLATLDTPTDTAESLLATVGLAAPHASRYPAELSGGEQQRVAIARALASGPDLIVADEPVSALDVSVRAAILNLLADLQQAGGPAYIFISHDLSAVRHIAHDVAVMYLGTIMQQGPTGQIFAPPWHPYTEALLSAIPAPDPDVPTAPIRLHGVVPGADAIPAGCPFHTRCPRKLGSICETDPPPWREAGAGHGILCHIPLDDLQASQTAAP